MRDGHSPGSEQRIVVRTASSREWGATWIESEHDTESDTLHRFQMILRLQKPSAGVFCLSMLMVPRDGADDGEIDPEEVISLFEHEMEAEGVHALFAGVRALESEFYKDRAHLTS